jgi:DNA polymerase-3 subunit epsilon
MSTFVALDFETANFYPNSACAVGIVRVEGLKTMFQGSYLIKPPNSFFLNRFVDLHGITWDHVKDGPTFGELWPKIEGLFEGVDFLAAHNASFDRGVLVACKQTYKNNGPDFPFLCTVNLARRVWGIYPTKLPLVCRRLGIELRRHHDALDDALACAEIVIRALREETGRKIIKSMYFVS